MGGKKSNHLRKLLRSFGAVRNWQLLLILIPLLFVTATLLRLDHIKMVELRDAVVAADVAGNDEEIAATLEKLHDFVLNHVIVNVVESNGIQSITLGTGTFYLENQYLRAANAAIERAESELVDDSNPNGNIYAAVGAVCRQQAIVNHWTWDNPGYLNCWTTELAKYPASDNFEANLTAKVPSTELYRVSFASPIWAPCWSGWAMLACAIILIIVKIRILIWLILKVALFFLKERY